jgi:hypothetical protein
MNMRVANVTESHDGIAAADPVLRHIQQMTNAAVARYNRLAYLLVKDIFMGSHINRAISSLQAKQGLSTWRQVEAWAQLCASLRISP